MLVISISPLTFIDDQINPIFKKIAYANFVGKWVNAGNLHLIILISFPQCFAPLQPILLSYLQLAKKWLHCGKMRKTRIIAMPIGNWGSVWLSG